MGMQKTGFYFMETKSFKNRGLGECWMKQKQGFWGARKEVLKKKKKSNTGVLGRLEMKRCWEKKTKKQEFWGAWTRKKVLDEINKQKDN